MENKPWNKEPPVSIQPTFSGTKIGPLNGSLSGAVGRAKGSTGTGIR
jgi:hypothetical protein